MTDKEKIKEQANIDISNLRMAQEQGIITEFGGGELEALEGIVDFIDSLQGEPVSRTPADVESAMQEVEEKSKAFTEAHQGENADTILAQMRGEEPVSKDLEEAAEYYCKSTLVGSPYIKKNAFKAGAKWQKANLWKPADGDDLPEIDREVIAFQETFPTDVDVPSLLKIVIAHRLNPEGYDGKSITTGKVEYYDVQTYGKGGWNIPDVVFWLDIDLPKMEG